MRNVSVLFIRCLFLCAGICGLTVFFAVPPASASTSQSTSPSFIRLIQASPYLGTVDVFLDGSQLLSSSKFGAVTDYATIPSPNDKVQVALVGKGVNATALTQTVPVSPGAAYTVAAIGTSPTKLSLQVFLDNNMLAPGKTKLRLYQLAPDGGPVTVTSKGQVLLSGIQYLNVSNYVVVPATASTFTVFSPTQLVTLTTSTTLSANKIESLFIVGMFKGSPQSTLILTQSTGFPNLPNTGSVPYAPSQAGTTASFLLWLLPATALLLLLCIGIGFSLRRSLSRR